MKLMVPLTAGVVVPPASTELMKPAAMAVPALPAPGAPTVSVGENLATVVSDIPAPQAEVAVLLLVSPP